MQDSNDLNDFLKQLAHEEIRYQEWKLRIIQWVSQSPTRAIKAVRKQEATEFLDVPRRTIERWLNDFTCSGSRTGSDRENANVKSFDWQSLVRETWRKQGLGRTSVPLSGATFRDWWRGKRMSDKAIAILPVQPCCLSYTPCARSIRLAVFNLLSE